MLGIGLVCVHDNAYSCIGETGASCHRVRIWKMLLSKVHFKSHNYNIEAFKENVFFNQIK